MKIKIFNVLNVYYYLFIFYIVNELEKHYNNILIGTCETNRQYNNNYYT